MVVPAGKVIKEKSLEPDKLYILLKGKVKIEGPKYASKSEMILVNEYYPGQSFCDPLLNETASAQSKVTVGSQPAMLFYLSKSAFS